MYVCGKVVIIDGEDKADTSRSMATTTTSVAVAMRRTENLLPVVSHLVAPLMFANAPAPSSKTYTHKHTHKTAQRKICCYSANWLK